MLLLSFWIGSRGLPDYHGIERFAILQPLAARLARGLSDALPPLSFAPDPVTVAIEVPGITRIPAPYRFRSCAPGSCTVAIIDFAFPSPRGLAGWSRTCAAMAVPCSCLSVIVTTVSGQPAAMGIGWLRRRARQQDRHQHERDCAILPPARQGAVILPHFVVRNWHPPDLPRQNPCS